MQVNAVKDALAPFCSLFSAMAALSGHTGTHSCKEKPGTMGELFRQCCSFICVRTPAADGSLPALPFLPIMTLHVGQMWSTQKIRHRLHVDWRVHPVTKDEWCACRMMCRLEGPNRHKARPATHEQSMICITSVIAINHRSLLEISMCQLFVRLMQWRAIK